MPINLLVLGLYRLQVYYYNEIQQGYCGLGEYHLQFQFASLSWPSDELLEQQVSTLEEIVSIIQQDDNDMLADDDKTGSQAETPVENTVENPVETAKFWVTLIVLVNVLLM